MSLGIPHSKTLTTRSLLPVIALLVLSACGGAQNEVRESLLNRGTGAEPESLDTHKARTTEAGNVQRDLGEGLTGYTAEGELIFEAAESVDVSEDGHHYTFALRPSARWSNGDSVTAEDFVYSFRRLVDPQTAAFFAQSLAGVANATEIIAGEMPPATLGVEALDKLTLKVSLRHPVPYFLELLTHPSTFPAHRPSIDAHGDAHARPGNLVTNGAYKLVAWEVGSYIELIRNEYYWNNAETAVDRVRHHVTPEANVELNRYRSGELDTTSNVPSEAFAQMKKERPGELRVAPTLAIYYYGFNLTKPPFKDKPKLRQALSMAIDRDVLTQQITGRGEAPAYGWVPPGVKNYNAQRFSYADLPTAERHARARQLYEEAGYSDKGPLEVEVRYNTADSHRRIAIAIQSMWRDVLGVEAKLINEEFQVLLANMRTREVTQVFRSGWTGDYNDANTFLTILESDNSSNMPGFSNDEYDDLMRRASAQTDALKRQLYMEEAERLLLREHPVIPLYFVDSRSMVSPRIRGWGNNILNYHYSKHLSIAE